MKVIFCIPTLKKPFQATLDSLRASIPLFHAKGWEEGLASEIGCPYISNARATMLWKAMDANADVIVFIDHDVSWQPEDLLKLVESEGDVVSGTYRFKHDDEEEYMGGLLPDAHGRPQVRADGAVLAHAIPAGFLKITREGVKKFMRAYPELLYGDVWKPHIDLFNHGAINGVWYGEDYAFAKRWNEKCGQIWLLPDLNIDHHTTEKAYKGNYHQYLLRLPGGSESNCPEP